MIPAEIMAHNLPIDSPTLLGNHVRLEPLALGHAEGLVAAATAAPDRDPVLYQWSPVPQTLSDVNRYIETAVAWREQGTCVPFTIRAAQDGRIIGSTRFWNIEHWTWPSHHAEFGRREVDACEIGYTWLSRPSLRTPANTEAKLLMLTHAFESWNSLRVCLHTDVRNLRSRAAIERIGGRLEGILRSHRLAADYIPRDSARFSILDLEWREIKQRLYQRLNRA
jgi:RimJ/RimL family protein N-acetyltransferase